MYSLSVPYIAYISNSYLRLTSTVKSPSEPFVLLLLFFSWWNFPPPFSEGPVFVDVSYSGYTSFGPYKFLDVFPVPPTSHYSFLLLDFTPTFFPVSVECVPGQPVTDLDLKSDFY